jgi:NAD(P)-dependent dehydrogenase (short-subunit alcohol dehydrogenase family)
MNVLITGASSGIGAALARKMAARGLEGGTLCLAARRRDRLEALVAELGTGAGGTRARAVEIDVSRPADTAAAVLQLDDEVGGLDLVVANAGIGGRGKSAAETTWQDVEKVFATNMLGAVATLWPLIPRMIARCAESGGVRRGHIAAVSSMAAELPMPVAPEYNASKAAITFFLECAQGDLPARGVDVTIIHPGFIKTDLTAKNKFPMPFLVECEDAAQIIDDGLVRRATHVRFPLGLVGLMGLGKVLPRSVKNAVVSRSAQKK